jgi:hypothetical protein
MYAMFEEQLHAPFDWSTHNCGMFVVRVTDAMTDNARSYLVREHIHDEASAKAMIESCGGLEGVVTRFMGEPEPIGTRPRRGDVVLFDGGDGESVGIVDRQIVSVGEGGLRRVPLKEAKRVWRV